jgi:hypothetical protein
MRLHLTLPELEKGETTQTGTTERVLDLQMLINDRHPVAIVPILNHDHKIISAVLLTDSESYTSNTLKIRFIPFWCSAFTLCSAKKDSLLALTMQFDDGQYWVDKEGWHQSNLTVDGPGTDPKTVYNSQFLLGDMLAEYPRPRVLDTAIKLIRKKYLLCQEEERKKDAILT